MNSTDVLYMLLDLDEIGEYVIPAVKRAINGTDPILPPANLRDKYHFSHPPLWAAIEKECSSELVSLLANAHYDPNERFDIYCDKFNPNVQEPAEGEDVATEDCISYIMVPMNLREYVVHLKNDYHILRRPFPLYKQYIKILDALR
jgi:hypothetical protein